MTDELQLDSTAGDLAQILRDARKVAGRTLDEAAVALNSSKSKLSRMERGEVRISPLDAYTLFRYYNWPREKASRTSGHTVGHPPLEAFDNGIPPWMRPFLEYEGTAMLIQQYQRDMIPGLLRAPDEVASLAVYLSPDSMGVRELESDLQIRRLRRFLDSSTLLHVIVEESVLYRHLQMAGQAVPAHVDHMLAMAAHERVRVQILPLEAGLVEGMTSTFTAFTLPDQEAGAVSISHGPGTLTYMTLPAAYMQYQMLFSRLSQFSLDPEQTIERIRDLRDRLLRSWSGSSQAARG